MPDMENRLKDHSDDHVSKLDPVNERYYGNPLPQLEGNGVQFELRAKLAIDFVKELIKSPNATYETDNHANELVKQAFDIADAVMWEAAERGYLKGTPPVDELPHDVATLLRLSARVSIAQQLIGQEVAAEMAPKVAPVGPSAFNPNPRGRG